MLRGAGGGSSTKTTGPKMGKMGVYTPFCVGHQKETYWWHMIHMIMKAFIRPRTIMLTPA